MSTLAKKTGGGGLDLGPMAPPGVHQAVCVDVIDLGVVETSFEGKPRKREMIHVIWQLITRAQQRRYLVGKRYTLSLSEKATLRKDLESWRGRAFTSTDETDGFETRKLIGVNCMLNLQHVSKPTGNYCNVIAIMPLYGGTPKIQADNYTRPGEAVDDHDDDADPFAQDAAPVTQLGSPTGPPPVTDDDIPF
jgi:hypothetical protein